MNAKVLVRIAWASVLLGLVMEMLILAAALCFGSRPGVSANEKVASARALATASSEANRLKATRRGARSSNDIMGVTAELFDQKHIVTHGTKSNT